MVLRSTKLSFKGKKLIRILTENAYVVPASNWLMYSWRGLSKQDIAGRQHQAN